MGNYTFEHLNSINLKHYVKPVQMTDHLCKMTNTESAQANSHSIVTMERDQQPLSFDSQMKRNLSKTITTKRYPKNAKKTKTT